MAATDKNAQLSDAAFALMASFLFTTANAGQIGCQESGEPDSSKFCCSTENGVSGYYNAVGHDDFISDVYILSSDSFFEERGNTDPRSNCKSANGNQLCISGATYSKGAMSAELAHYIANQAAGCQNPDGSAQFYIRLEDGSSSTLCVSNRADGCGVYF